MNHTPRPLIFDLIGHHVCAMADQMTPCATLFLNPSDFAELAAYAGMNVYPCIYGIPVVIRDNVPRGAVISPLV